jgi:hypothetical protein
MTVSKFRIKKKSNYLVIEMVMGRTCHLILVVIGGRLDRLLEVFVLFGSASGVLKKINYSKNSFVMTECSL